MAEKKEEEEEEGLETGGPCVCVCVCVYAVLGQRPQCTYMFGGRVGGGGVIGLMVMHPDGLERSWV